MVGHADGTSLMRRAIGLARTAMGWTNPNPLVGAVVEKDGRVIGEGCHERFGESHAERNALRSCTESAAGATVYVTLEPCNHTGHQPPCVDALIEAGVAKVVVGSRDPNPLASGKGVLRLRAAGIEVQEDFLRDECDALNPLFFHYITTGRPYVVAKWAMSADGKIATASGDSRWVSSERSCAQVHDLRHRLAAIVVGVETVIVDNPSLTARRGEPSRDPVRVVCDSRLRIPEGCTLITTAHELPTIVACGCDAAQGPQAAKAERLERAGALVLRVPDACGRVSLPALLDRLGEYGIDSLLLEGGGTLNASFFAEGLVDEAIVYIAPKVVGGVDAKTPVTGTGTALMADAHLLGQPTVELVGSDVRLTYHMDRGR